MSHITTCLRCSTRLRVSDQITERTVLCPRCLADVDNSQEGMQIRPTGINTDVKRDLSVGTIVLGVLIGLCILGVIVAMASTSGFKGEYTVVGRAFVLMFIFSALDVLVSIACIRALVRWGVSGVRAPSAGRVLGIIFLSLCTVVAVIVFFFMTCWGLASLK